VNPRRSGRVSYSRTAIAKALNANPRGHPQLNITIRKEEPHDIEAIYSVTAAAFLNAPHTDHNEQYIVNALRVSGALSVSLVAEYQGEVIGHIALSPVTISDSTPDWYGLGPISVMPNWQRQGIGSKLMNEAIQQLRNLNAQGCVLLGEPSYYGRFGFLPIDGLSLAGVPPEYFQARVLHGVPPQGSVCYHPSFSTTI